MLQKPFTTSVGARFNAHLTEASDAGNSVSTTYSMEVDDTFSGTITSNDSDWIAIELTAGEDYVFSVWGTGGASTGLIDTYLTLLDDNGDVVASNDDHDPSVGVLFSVLEFSASETGTYFLNVEGFSGDDVGAYTLSAADDEFSVTQVATYLTEIFWGFPAPLAFEASEGDTLTYNVTGLTADGRRLAEYALEAWTSLTGIEFAASTSAEADLIFDDSSNGAFAGPNAFNGETGEIFQSTVNVGTDWLDFYGTTLDSYSFLTYMHEIGHALGLGHAGAYDGFATFSDAHYSNDSIQMTIMSYFGQDVNPNIDVDYATPINPQIADIAAIQSLYGASTTYNAGDTVWGYNNTVDGYLGDIISYLVDGAPISSDLISGEENMAFAIYDAGGHDTADLSLASEGMIIDLTPGNFNGVFGQGQFIIAEGTILEDVIGTEFGDAITGNERGNTLVGNGGADSIMGMLGGDNIFGGDGGDYLDGGLSAANLYGGSGNDMLLGGTSVDALYGGTGNDDMRGGTGADTLYGGDDNDSLFGNTGVDLVYGGDGDDFISPGNGVDTVFGGNGNDHIIGRTGFDTLHGDDGNDSMFGSEGQDVMYGGADDDFMSGGFGFDTLEGGTGNDTIYGNIGVDTLFGGEGDDTLFGATGNDELFGGDGNDTLYGAQGTDTLVGGAGDDVMLSGSGNDFFIFNDGDGNDTMTNFRMTIVGTGVGDTILLDQDVVGTAISGQEVVDRFGEIVDGNVVLRFTDEMSITFDTHSDFATLGDSILIV